MMLGNWLVYDFAYGLYSKHHMLSLWGNPSTFSDKLQVEVDSWLKDWDK